MVGQLRLADVGQVLHRHGLQEGERHADLLLGEVDVVGGQLVRVANFVVPAHRVQEERVAVGAEQAEALAAAEGELGHFPDAWVSSCIRRDQG